MVKCERNYRRNHLRWYRITRIKRGGRQRRKKSGEEERKREGGRRKRPALTSRPGYRQVTLAKQPPPHSLSPFPLSLSLFLSCSSFLSSPAISFLFYRANARSSSVIDRNLSLTSLPPGAKILPGHCGLDLWLLRCRRRRCNRRVIVHFLLLFLRSLFLRARFLQHQPACSMIIEPARPPLLDLRRQRSLFTESISEVNAIFIYVLPSCRCSHGANRSRSLWHTNSALNARII